MPSEKPSLQRCIHCGAELPPGAAACAACGRPTEVGAGPATPAPITGTVLQGKWQLDRKLGQGGMGAVYLAHERDLDRQVAIKVLSDALCEDAELVQRFEREARMMARLDHPNLVPVYAVGREGRVPFIVMKALSGATLAHLLKERGRLPLREVISITRQLCAGLQFVHDHGVVHRDIKPGNVFIAPNGHVTLLDLGVARDAGSALTKSGVLIGTPRYMAPEQITAQECDHRSDLYSLSSVIYEMVTGTTVFPSDSDYSVMRAHVDQPPPDLFSVEGVPAALATALLKGLSKSPADRFQSAREMSEAFEKVGQSPEVQALPDPPSRAAPLVVPSWVPPQLSATAGGTRVDASLPPTTKSPRRARRPVLWVVAFIGFAAIGSGIGVVLSKLGRQEPPIVQPPPPPPVAVKPDPVKPPEPPPPEPPPPTPPPVVVAPVVTEPQPPPHAVVKKGPGEIRCVTTTSDGEASWAYVDVDGLRKGTTPLTLKLSPGEHELVFRRPGFATQTRKVTAVAGEVKRVTVELTP